MTPKAKRRVRDNIYFRAMGNNVKLEAEISLCVFMFPGYPLQIKITLQRYPGENLGVGYAVDRTKTAATYTDRSVKDLLAKVRILACPRCSTPAFDPATIDTNRGGLCEKCFLADLEAGWAKEQEAINRKLARRDRRMKKNGMAVRVTAWVHRKDGGHDYQLDWYLDAHPTSEQVGDMLLEEGSCCLDDYKITIL